MSNSGLQQTIEFTIKDGKIEFDAKNFNGDGCDAATRFIQELGESDVQYKPEHRRGRQTVRA